MGVKKVALPPKDDNIFALAYGYFTTIMIGMFKTWSIFWVQVTRREKSNTREWPEEPAQYSERFKGKHFLTKRPDGEIRCTACFLCATNCPAECIHIEAGEHPSSKTEKYPVRFEIDILRCVFCGFCEEACPVDAIRLGPEYAITGLAGEKWVYTKSHLAERETLNNGITSIKDEALKHPLSEGDEKTNSNPHEKLHSIAKHLH